MKAGSSDNPGARSDTTNHLIWRIVARVPKGQVASYGQIADLAGYPRAARRVSRALRQAPPQLQLPWHRIIRRDGQLGFAPGSAQYHQQRDRLAAEGVLFTRRGRVPQADFWQPDLPTLLMLEDE